MSRQHRRLVPKGAAAKVVCPTADGPGVGFAGLDNAHIRAAALRQEVGVTQDVAGLLGRNTCSDLRRLRSDRGRCRCGLLLALKKAWTKRVSPKGTEVLRKCAHERSLKDGVVVEFMCYSWLKGALTAAHQTSEEIGRV